jgi:hypothetical protein
MTDYYGNISALGVCAEILFFSGMYVRGSISSNDLGIANKLVDALPPLVQQVGAYAYNLQKSKGE